MASYACEEKRMKAQSIANDMAYDPGVALDFFKSAGKAEAVAQGATIFAEKEQEIPLLRRHKMYLLLKGDVGLLTRGKPIGAVKAGEIFGELALISHAPRSASALAKTDCRVIALDDKEFHSALARKPAFALMLMSMMIRRLRETITQLSASGALSKDEAWEEAAAFNRAQLAALMRGLADDPPLYYRAGDPILARGQTGLRMYAVLEGRVAVSIDGRVIEKLGPGGVFGEAAIVGQSPRLASALAETDCELLPIARGPFLSLVRLSPEFADTMLTSLAERLRFLTARLN